MEQTIKYLIRLQKCDNKVGEINRKRSLCPVRISTLENELEGALGKADEEQGKVETIKKERRALEQEIQDLNGRVEKSKGKLANIKSNKEYTAALKEIEDLEKEKARREDRILEIMEQADAVTEQLKAIEKLREEFKNKFDQDKKAVVHEMEHLERSLRELEAEAGRIRKEIDPNILKKYDLIRTRKDGIGISAVVKGICRGCNMGIPPQKFNELIHGEELMNCPHCMRIMYWGEDERFQ